jgi:glycerol-3-phosphate acyltransferase PlsX
MGGDHAPGEIVKGSMLAARRLGVTIVLVGDSGAIGRHLTDSTNITVTHTDEVISYDDDPVKAVREKSGSSMVTGLKLLAEGEGGAFVSAGNSGALVTGTTLIVKRIKGIRRIVMAPLIPADSGAVVLLDGGANTDCAPEMLAQFAVMGDVYAKAVLGIESPRVGLLNNGAEAHKGNAAAREAYRLIAELPIRFAGNVEARDVLSGAADVLVADGFAGNILLKAIEGTALYFSKNLKSMLTKNTATKLSALFLKKGIAEFKKKFDYNEHGGAPLLGAAGVVIKAHGSSKADAFYNAIRQAERFARGGAVEELAARTGNLAAR